MKLIMKVSYSLTKIVCCSLCFLILIFFHNACMIILFNIVGRQGDIARDAGTPEIAEDEGSLDPKVAVVSDFGPLWC